MTEEEDKKMIRNLKTDEEGWFTTATFDSKVFLPGEMSIMIFTDDGAGPEDAARCIEHFNSLDEKLEIIASIEKRLVKFFLYMYEEWAALADFEIYARLAESLKDVREGYENGRKLSSYLSGPGMNVYLQQNGDVGYGIECECPWEPEHKCLILIRNDECVYVGPSDMLDPWDEEYLHCVWDD